MIRKSLSKTRIANLKLNDAALVSYVLYHNSAAPGFVKMILDKRARLGYNHLQTR